jgi:hypothetical protein
LDRLEPDAPVIATEKPSIIKEKDRSTAKVAVNEEPTSVVPVVPLPATEQQLTEQISGDAPDWIPVDRKKKKNDCTRSSQGRSRKKNRPRYAVDRSGRFLVLK